MYFLYKYIRDKRRKAKAAREAQNAGQSTNPPAQSRTSSSEGRGDSGAQTPCNPQQAPPPPKPGGLSSSTKWRIMLMLALLLPVFFETLDYTGPSPCPICTCNRLIVLA